MSKKQILIFLLIGVVIAAVVLYFTWMYEKIEVKLYAAEVTEDGAILDKDVIFLSGIRDGSKNKIKFDEFVLPNVQCYLPETNGFQSRVIPQKPYEWISGGFIYDSNGTMEMFDLYLSADYSWCVIKTDSNRYFVGSIAEDFDTVALLEKVFP